MKVYHASNPCCLCNASIRTQNFTNHRLMYTNFRVHAPTAAFNNSVGPSGGTDGISNSSTNSFLRHPAIAQGEALRQFYLSTCPMEQLEVIRMSKDYLDPSTSLHMLCHLADLSLKGQLEGDPASQDSVLHALYTILAEDLSNLPAQSIGAILWSMASVQQSRQLDKKSTEGQMIKYNLNSSKDWKVEAMEHVAILEGACGKVAKYNTKELVNILFSIGTLLDRPTPSKAVVTYSTELMQQLAARIDSTPYVKGSLSPSDFADLVSVCANMFVDNKENKKDETTSLLPPAAVQLMDLVAGEVRRQLANRASSRAAFLPRELTRFLTNFASLEMINNANVDGLFDVISGFVVNRIRSKHLNAVTKPEDLAAVLAAYAKQQHRSVSVPELLTAVGEQLRINAARMQELHTSAKIKIATTSGADAETEARTRTTSSSESKSPLEGGPPDLGCSLPTLLSILQSHKDLGFAPDPLTLTALLPGIKRILLAKSTSTTSFPQNVVHLLELFLVFEFNPGPRMLELLVARVEDFDDTTSGKFDKDRDAHVDAARTLVTALQEL